MSVSQSKKAGRPQAREIRKKIIAAAARQFGVCGFKETRVEDIAAEVGIVRSAVLHHFGTKRNLYDAVLDELYGESIKLIYLSLQEEGDIRDRLYNMIDRLVEQMIRQPEIAFLSLRSTIEPDKEIRADAKERARPYARSMREFVLAARPNLSNEEAVTAQLRLTSALFGHGLYFVTAMPSLTNFSRKQIFSAANVKLLKEDLFAAGCRALDLK